MAKPWKVLNDGDLGWAGGKIKEKESNATVFHLKYIKLLLKLKSHFFLKITLL